MPEDSDFLCGGWIWDPVLRELRYHERTRKGWKEEPEQVERLPAVRSVTWHRWSQAPMQTATGETMPTSLSRVAAAYAGGGDLTVNENDRECAGKLARAIAEAYDLEVVEEGAPGGRRRGNLPSRDEMGRLVSRSGSVEVTLDEASREIEEARRRFPFGKSRRRVSLAEVRGLELTRDVYMPKLGLLAKMRSYYFGQADWRIMRERFTLWATLGLEEQERLAIASHQGYEGWADPEEWREFAREMGRSLGVEVVGADA